MVTKTVPKLITFDGEARSGKGTIVQLTKDYLRDECGYKVMLIDRGQAFRSLVVAAKQSGTNLDSPDEIDAFLAESKNLDYATQFVSNVYRMDKDERDALLYTNEVGENSAKIGARPASQKFVIGLTKRWMENAASEGYEVVLVDGRALENIAREMHDEGLCEYRLGLYFICDSIVGARRTLGYATTHYDKLSDDARSEVDGLVQQITLRNQADKNREVERLVPPANAPKLSLPNAPETIEGTPPMVIFDTSLDMTKEAMASPVATLARRVLL